MIPIGNFFFKYRNFLFIFLYLALFIPSLPLFGPQTFGINYYRYPLILGLLLTVSGQLIRGMTISLAYIVRGGKNKKVYADDLVTTGIFAHCRNPLYVGNILMLLGLGVMMNSMFYILVVIPLFLFIYQSIVLAEEHYLRGKFGGRFDLYCTKTNRWTIRFRGLGKTIRGMQFNGKRWLLKEYNTQAIWLMGMLLILFFKYPVFDDYYPALRNVLFIVLTVLIGIFYFTVRYKKKQGIWNA